MHRPGVTVPESSGSRPGYRTDRFEDVYPTRFLFLQPAVPRSPFPYLDPAVPETWQLCIRHLARSIVRLGYTAFYLLPLLALVSNSSMYHV
jgi:hypothetical protein